MEHLGAHAQRFREGGGPDRDDHEFLDVEVVVRVRPPVDDVHERDGKGLGARAAEVPVEGQGVRLGGRFRDRDRYAEHRVRAQVLLVRGAVQPDQELVQIGLIVRVLAHEMPRDRLVDVRDRLGDSLAQVSFRVAVPELQRLAGAGGSAGRDRRAANGAAPERHLDLERGRAPGVQDLACVYGFDLGHGRDRTLGSGPLAVKGKALTDGG